jgi:hypothetical protein
VIAGFLSEIHISIAGNPDDFAVEVGSHDGFLACFFQAVGLIVAEPIG